MRLHYKIKENHLFLIALLFIILIFISSNSFWTLKDSIFFGFPDFIIYEKIGRCGQTLNFQSLINLNIPEHFAERWIPNFFLGVISNKINIDLLTIYRITVFIIYTFIIFILYFSNYDLKNKILYFSFITFNPYSFRCFFAGSYNINDCLFYFSTFLFVFSLINKKIILILISILLGLISKQTSIFFIPILFLFSHNKFIPFKYFYFFSLIFVLSAILLKVSVIYLFNPMPSSTLRHIYGFFVWPFENPRLIHLYLFLSRIALFLILLSPILLFEYNYRINKIFIFSSILLILQPLLAGPAITGDGGIRLYVFALPFLFYPVLDIIISYRKFIYIFLINLFFSLHHNYSILSSKNSYIILIFILLFILLFYYNKVKNPI